MRLDDFFLTLDIDKARVLARFGNNSALYIKFINKFPSDTNCKDLQAATEALDYSKMEMTAHTLKGISGNFGFDRLYNLSDIVVKAVRAKDYASLESMVVAVVEEYDKIISLIEGGVEA